MSKAETKKEKRLRKKKEREAARKGSSIAAECNINDDKFDLAALVRDGSKERGVESKDSTKFGRWECFCVLFVLSIILWVAYLKIAEEKFGWSGIYRQKKEDSEDIVNFYEILELDYRADQVDIKRAYRKLAKKWHPDKNPDCDDCKQRMAKISTAYATLSNVEKRAVYDATLGSVSSLPSKSIKLNSGNFDAKVLASQDFWLVQVYMEWYKTAIDFAPVWEEAIIQYGDFINFGRIHGSRDVDLVRKLPTAIRDYPTTLCYHRGRFVKVFPTVTNPRIFLDQILTEYPNDVMTAYADEVPMLAKKLSRDVTGVMVLATSRPDPHMRMRALARRYQGILRIAQVAPKPLGGASKRPGKKKRRNKRTHFLNKQLRETFDLEGLEEIPAIFVIPPNSTPRDAIWWEGDVNADTLMHIPKHIIAKGVVEFNPYMYVVTCLDHDAVCIIYVSGCKGEKRDKSDFRWFENAASATLEDYEAHVDENFPNFFQFAGLDVTIYREFDKFCSHGEGDVQIYLTVEQAQHIIAWTEPLAKKRGVSLWEQVKEIHRYPPADRMVTAPTIKAPPPPSDPFWWALMDWLYNFDLNDPSYLHQCQVVGILVVGGMTIYAGGIQMFVLLIFAMSIMGTGGWRARG